MPEFRQLVGYNFLFKLNKRSVLLFNVNKKLEPIHTQKIVAEKVGLHKGKMVPTWHSFMESPVVPTWHSFMESPGTSSPTMPEVLTAMRHGRRRIKNWGKGLSNEKRRGLFNLNTPQVQTRKLVADKKCSRIYAARAKENLTFAGKNFGKGKQPLFNLNKPYEAHTRKTVAEKVGLSQRKNNRANLAQVSGKTRDVIANYSGVSPCEEAVDKARQTFPSLSVLPQQ